MREDNILKTHRLDEHLLKVGIAVRAPAAVYIGKDFPELQLSLFFPSSFARLLLPPLDSKLPVEPE